MNTVLDPLLMPDQVRLTETDRQTAAAKLDSAVRQGTLTPPEANDRQDQLGAARTRGELRQVFDGVADAVPPTRPHRRPACRTGVWLVTCVVQFVVWVMMADLRSLRLAVVALVRPRARRDRCRSCGGRTSRTTARPTFR